MSEKNMEARQQAREEFMKDAGLDPLTHLIQGQDLILDRLDALDKRLEELEARLPVDTLPPARPFQPVISREQMRAAIMGDPDTEPSVP